MARAATSNRGGVRNTNVRGIRSAGGRNGRVVTSKASGASRGKGGTGGKGG